MIFLGPLYQTKEEKKILAYSRRGVSNAVAQFQARLLNGFSENGESVTIVNVLPVGTWPRQYKKLILPSEEWSFHNAPCYEVGGINLPFLKQWIRKRKTKKLLSRLTAQEKEVVIYSTYLPFLQAVWDLPADVKVTLIVTDLPEYYDFRKISRLKKWLRKRNTKKIYKRMSRIDNFVLLTEEMKYPLQVAERPYVVVEGIGESLEDKLVQDKRAVEKEIVFYSGGVHYLFGIAHLVEAVRSMTRSDVELWICGDGDAAEWVKEVSAQDARIRYFGFVPFERVAQLRKSATVLINPRPNEGEYTKYSFPSKTMEYMASGLPVVMHKLSSVPEEYDEYLTYIQENSAEGIKQALEKVFAMSMEERALFGRRARSFILENKNETTQTKKILRMIKRN